MQLFEKWGKKKKKKRYVLYTLSFEHLQPLCIWPHDKNVMNFESFELSQIVKGANKRSSV